MNCVDALFVRLGNMTRQYGFFTCKKSLGSKKSGGSSGGTTLNKGPFDYLSDTDVSNGGKGEEPLFATFGSIYHLLLVLGVIGLVISIITIGVKLMLFKNGAQREDAKSELGFKAVIAVLLFSVLTFAGVWHVFLADVF